MNLGEKLRQARLEAGLTQKQLCQDIVTRNMLSQIENGTAKPSMKTLEQFARRLGKSVSFFLEEKAIVSPNTAIMEQARKAFDSADYGQAQSLLEQYREPDGVYDREKQLLQKLCLLELARQALAEGKSRYAKELLEACDTQSGYCREALRRSKLLLLGSIPGEKVSARLPSLDAELFIRASEALEKGHSAKAGALLDGCENQSTPRWQLLRGTVWLKRKQYNLAKRCLQAAEAAYPQETAPLLEICFRELGDFQNAYAYACKQRK